MPTPHHPSAAVLQALGLLEGLADLSMETVGQILADESLPQRVRLKPAKE